MRGFELGHDGRMSLPAEEKWERGRQITREYLRTQHRRRRLAFFLSVASVPLFFLPLGILSWSIVFRIRRDARRAGGKVTAADMRATGILGGIGNVLFGWLVSYLLPVLLPELPDNSAVAIVLGFVVFGLFLVALVGMPFVVQRFWNETELDKKG